MLPRWSHKKVLRRNQAAGIIPPAQGIPGRCDAIHGAIFDHTPQASPTIKLPAGCPAHHSLPESHSHMAPVQSLSPLRLRQMPPRSRSCGQTRHLRGRHSPRGGGVLASNMAMESRCSKIIPTTNCLSYFSVRGGWNHELLVVFFCLQFSFPRSSTHTNRKWLATHPLPAVRPPPRAPTLVGRIPPQRR
jgi:hypothetical protein